MSFTPIFSFGSAGEGVADGAVAGAAAQVAREFFLGQLAGDGLTMADMVLVHAEEAHHEAGSAEPALGAVALDHRFLRGVERDRLWGSGGIAHRLDQRVFRQVLYRP